MRLDGENRPTLMPEELEKYLAKVGKGREWGVAVIICRRDGLAAKQKRKPKGEKHEYSLKPFLVPLVPERGSVCSTRGIGCHQFAC